MGVFEAGKHIGYTLNSNAVGLFVYVVSGAVTVQQKILRRGDSIGIVDEEQTMIHTAEPSKLLVIEVSMND
jgi:redox-sensitive bicupin YhaK (pirin superfamily)